MYARIVAIPALPPGDHSPGAADNAAGVFHARIRRAVIALRTRAEPSVRYEPTNQEGVGSGTRAARRPRTSPPAAIRWPLSPDALTRQPATRRPHRVRASRTKNPEHQRTGPVDSFRSRALLAAIGWMPLLDVHLAGEGREGAAGGRARSRLQPPRRLPPVRPHGQR